MRTIDWDPKKNCITLIDQTQLPKEPPIIECHDTDTLIEAIKSLSVRGAPALGAAGAFGVALAARNIDADSLEDFKDALRAAAEVIANTRPTAVNLGWGVNRALIAALNGDTIDDIKELALDEAKKVADEDVEINRQIGEHGAQLLENGDTVLTHCNAGRLACVDRGTALGVVRSAVEQGKNIKVIACETRPLNQGSRITTYELMQDEIPVTLIADSMSAYVMGQGMVDKIIVGADRIVRDAVFNKIGTHMHAIVAKAHEIPFYVAAPISTFDLEHEAKDITIEMRNPDELRRMQDVQSAPPNVDVLNPAFDATPMELVTAIITEQGVVYPALESADIASLIKPVE